MRVNGNRISIGTLDIDETEIKAVSDVIKSGYLSSNKCMDEFESKMARIHGKQYGVLVNSGQTALEVALVLAQSIYGKKLRVVLPATTYAATLWAILNTGCTPVFCDIDDNYCLDYHQLQQLNYDIVLPVDIGGYPATPNSTIKYIIEDACESVGNTQSNYGDIVCLSFYVSHIITTGCGGMICLNNKRLQEYAKSYISHGRMFGGDFTKFKDQWVDRFLFDKIGSSNRLTAMEAAFGLAQLKKLDHILLQRRKNAQLLSDYLDVSKIKDKIIFPTNEYIAKSVFQFYPITLVDDIDRTTVLNKLFEEGIDSRVLLSLTNQPIVKELFGNIEHLYPNSMYVNNSGFFVGCHQGLTENDIQYLAESLERAIGGTSGL